VPRPLSGYQFGAMRYPAIRVRVRVTVKTDKCATHSILGEQPQKMLVGISKRKTEYKKVSGN
jgi:hypothetical protein